jgi:pyridoxal phosphate enzyme (YggS family)
MSEFVSSIRDRYEKVVNSIANSAIKAGRKPESTRLVVVTKLQPPEVIQAAIEAGAHILGENYAEEAAGKISVLKPQSAVEWHMIGHVQSRKALMVAQNFDLVHSLDSLRLAQRLNRSAFELGRTLPVLLEFNVSGENSKTGWEAADDSRWPDLLADVNAIVILQNLKVHGLMTMPPLSTDPEAARIYFRQLRRLRDFLSKRIPQVDWTELSMGTSGDFAVAVEEGATLVRIGQAILGPRPAAEVK